MIEKDPRVRDAEFLGWLVKAPCIACLVGGVHKRGVHAAHVRFADAEAGWREAGMQGKPSDRRAVGLCPPHHTGDVRRVRMTQHDMNERAFWAALGIDVIALCTALSEAFEAGGEAYVVVARFAAIGRRTLSA